MAWDGPRESIKPVKFGNSWVNPGWAVRRPIAIAAESGPAPASNPGEFVLGLLSQ